MSIKNTLKEIVKNSLKDICEIDIEQIKIEIPKNNQYGDYYTDIPILLTKKLKKTPLDIAKLIIKNLNNEQLIEKIEIFDQGFITFYLKKEYLLTNINTILEKKNHYGRNNIGHNQKVNIDFTNIKTNKILDLNQGREASYGDNLYRIMAFCGYDVTKEYYIDNDNKDNLSQKEATYDYYQRDKLISNDNFNIKKDLDKFRVNFNIFTTKQSLYDKCLVDEVLTKLRYTNYCYISEDSLWLKTTSFGDSEDRLLITKDGEYTNLISDITYHITRINKGYDKIIDILPPEKQSLINSLNTSLCILEKKSNILDIKTLQMVKLINSNKLDISLVELINTIGINATRYLFASKKVDEIIEVDINEYSKESNNSKVYYIESTNAKICHILRKYKNNITKIDKFTTLNSDITYTILNKLCQFEDIVITACKKEEPYLITTYVYELTKLFNSFYEKENITNENKIYTSERLNLLLAIKIVINNSLDLIGIIPREEM